MAPTRPSAARAADLRVDRARAGGGGGRLATVARDFLLPPDLRLSEQERALMTGMLAGLVGTVADEIRVRLPNELEEASDWAAEEIVAELRRGGLLQHEPLVALLLRRADEVRIAEALGGGGSPVQGWTSDEVPAVAAAAMAVVLARAAARDRFGRPGLELGDCDAETAVHLSYSVAAVLAGRLENADEAVVAATVDLLGRHDEGQRLHALEAKLVIALENAGRLDGDLLGELGRSGEAGLLAQALARAGGIPASAAWALILDGEAGGMALLFRMAGQSRAVAATILAALAVALGNLDPAAEIDLFDSMDEADVETERARLRHPPAFAAAAIALGREHD